MRIRPSLLAALTLATAAQAGTIAGRVTDDAGRPLEGVTLYLDPQNAQRLVKGDQTATTDSLGAYTLTASNGATVIRQIAPAGYGQLSPLYGGIHVTVPSDSSCDWTDRETGPGLKPYIAFAWGTPPSALSNVVGTVWYQASSSPADIAARLKALPVGKRALFRWESDELLQTTADRLTVPGTKTLVFGPWLPKGAAAESAFETKFLAALASAGATVDYLQLDNEWSISCWTLVPGQLAAIEADSRWPALASKFGVSPSYAGGEWYTDEMQAFTLAMQVTAGAYFHQAFCTPLQAQFPNAHCSEFGEGVVSAQVAPQTIDLNGCDQESAMPMHGDTQGPGYYAQVGNLAIDPAGQGANFSNPLPVICWQASSARGYAQSGLPSIPWFCGKAWATSKLVNSPYYDELVYHVMLGGGSVNANLWNATAATAQADAAALNADLVALQKQTVNAARLLPLTTATVPFGSSLLVSGVELPTGKRLFRITVPAIPRAAETLSTILPGDTTATKITIPPGQPGIWYTE